MNTITKLMTLLLALVLPVIAVAEDVYDFEEGGIYYKIVNDEASVTYKSFSYIDHDPYYESDYAGDVVIPPTVTYDGKTYPVTSIGNCAFYRRRAVTSITIPSSITSIGWSAFFDCTGLTRVTITDLTAWCNIDIDFNSNPLYYAQHLYLNDTEVTDLVIPEGITEIDGFAFYGCVGLTSVKIPNSVASIGEGAFMDCTQLNSVTCLATTPPIIKYENCFDDECYSNATLFVPAAVVNMYRAAPIWKKFIVKSIGSDNPTGENIYDFEEGGIYYKIVDNEAYVTYQNVTYVSHDPDIYTSDYTGDVVIPSTVTHNGQTYTVTCINSHAFEGCWALTGVTIPNSVTTISFDAFKNCTGLASIEIPSSVTTIYSDAFLGCTGLTRVEITDLVAWCNISYGGIGTNPLYYAHHLYLDGYEVTDLSIPDAVTSIGQSAFFGCTGLKTVEIPNSVTTIGRYAFYQCTGLTRATVGNAVTTIEEAAFYGCTALDSVSLGNSVESFGINAFYGCTALTGIVIPNSVTSIGVGSFWGCTSLENAIIGKCVTSIGIGAFKGCESLTSIDIPNSVTSIGAQAFSGCTGLTSVNLGSAVTTMGKDAFQNASSIGVLSCRATTPPTWEDMSMFTQNVYNHAELHVPIDTERAYKTSPYWGQFLKIIADVTIEIPGDVNGDGETNIGDTNSVIDVIINGGGIGGHSRIPACDVNGDGEVNISDVNAIIELILN
ncbi:MAG: leucine-rich repeat protein [Muribaculaceae bacterium]|nr:leucine-rich repeat protein [Muribaculaceae bacterium]